MSPRAAWRLEHLGFERSVDYAAGKLDWLAFDLPWEGTAQLVGSELDRDVPTCTIGAKVGEVRTELASAGLCIVVFDSGVVAGSLTTEALGASDDEVVDAVMDSGPRTVRPSEESPALTERMQKKGLAHMVVTRPDGRLVGVFRPEP
ncbi:MAG TPA: CBS domain-containing protein [Acidimicrobiia bacterium]|nr:CBS domain-containing protein [Acidimicrobiia bacterium]